MNLNDLLSKQGIDPQLVLVLRHAPYEPALKKVFPWLVAERPDLLDAYQRTHGPKLEKAIEQQLGAGYIASFLGHEAGKALFIGLFSIAGTKRISHDQFLQVHGIAELKRLGMNGWERERKNGLLFDLAPHDFYLPWQRRMIVRWPPPERSWWRRAHRNNIPVEAILEESALDAVVPDWDDMDFTWEELGILPSKWKDALSHWRGIYYIVDSTDGRGYVGSAYGSKNLLGRWMSYAEKGHGGNKLLRQRDHHNFHFSILQRVSPDLEPENVIRLENSWKKRLRTRAPDGLNEN